MPTPPALTNSLKGQKSSSREKTPANTPGSSRFGLVVGFITRLTEWRDGGKIGESEGFDMNPKLSRFDAILRSSDYGGIFPTPKRSQTPRDDFSMKCFSKRSRSRLMCIYVTPQINSSAPRASHSDRHCTGINAAATEDADTCYIAICRGVFDLLDFTFLQLLAVPDVFPWLGIVPDRPWRGASDITTGRGIAHPLPPP